jgi:DNA primase small subunit
MTPLVKVCVPIRADKCEEFNPLKVPDLNTINRELNEYQKTDKNIAEYKKTSLKPYIEYFEKFVTSMINDLNKSKY